MNAVFERLGFRTGQSPSSVALLVVDMQYFDAHRDWGEGRTAKDLGVDGYFADYFEQIDTVTPVIAGLLHTFRAKSMEVIHIRVAELTTDSRDVGYKQLVRGLVVPSDSKEAELLPTLDPVGDEIVVSKSSSGVFAVTNLDRILRNLGIDTLVFTGTSTGGCVQSAVYDATDLGYRTIIVEDACADSTRKSHANCLSGLRAQATEAVSSVDLSAALETLPDVDAKRRSGLDRVHAYQLDRPYLRNAGASEIEPYSAIFGPAVRQRPTPETAALVLIDVQRLTCDTTLIPAALMPSSYDFSDYPQRVMAALPKMETLLAMCRERSVPIIHVRTAGQLAGGRDLARKRRDQGLTVIVGDPSAEFMPEVAPIAGEAVLNKAGSSIFNGTGLDRLLHNSGISTLIVAGTSLDAAIEASIRSAGDRGYGTILLPEACAAASEIELQFLEMERGIINVCNIETVAALLAGHDDRLRKAE